MPPVDIVRERLLRQRIAGTGFERAADVVRWMGAVQSQDFPAAKWGLGLRSRASNDQDIEAEFAAGALLRTHVMRPTWHFVAPEDIRWLQALTAPRVKALNAYQHRNLELDRGLLRRSNAIIVKALRGGGQLTRLELGAILGKAGIRASGLRLTYLVFEAELDALICSGARRGKQHTYALLEERAPQARELSHDEALARLTLRYFTSHGPATVQDFSWWSGLPAAQARAGLAAVKSKLVEETLDGRTYWMTASRPSPRRPAQSACLLPNYDEYIVGYADRGAIFDAVHAEHLDARHNPLFMHTVVIDGRIVGTWKWQRGRETVKIRTAPFTRIQTPQLTAIAKAARRLAGFLGLKLESV